jgi:hypothetical protein
MTQRCANSTAGRGRTVYTLAAAMLAVVPGAQGQTVQADRPVFPATQLLQSSQQTVHLTVNANIELLSAQIAPGYGEFSIHSNDCPAGQIAAGTACNLVIRFSPTQPGWASAPAPIGRSAPLVVAYNDAGGTHRVSFALTGTGTQATGVLSPGIISDLVGDDVAQLTGFSGDGGPAAGARFNAPGAIAMDVLGNIYLADTDNAVIRLVYQAGSFPQINGVLIPGNIYTVAGVAPVGGIGQGGPGVDGILATQSPLSGPMGIALDGAGNLYIADSKNQAVRRVDALTGIITTVAGTLNSPASPGHRFAGDLGAATLALLDSPAQIAVDGYGNLFIADSGNHAVRVVYAGGQALANLIALEVPGAIATTGNLYTLAGGPGSSGGADGGLASAAMLNTPLGVMVDSAGNLYIADSMNHAVRRVDAVTGLIGTVFHGNDSPTALAVDVSDTIYFTLRQSCTVSAYNPNLQANLPSPDITLVAGNGSCTPSGDGGSSTLAGLGGAAGLVVDGFGDLFLLEADGVRHVSRFATRFDFGSVNVGDTSPIASVVLSVNDIVQPGAPNTDFTNFQIDTDPSPFSIVPFLSGNPNISDCNDPSNSGLPPGGACGAAFTFQPTVNGGPFTATARSIVGPSVQLSVTGSGSRPTASLQSGPLSFTSIVNETTSPAQVLTLTNTSAVRLSIARIYSSSFNFKETDTCGISTFAVNPSLAPGASCQISITFSASSMGTLNGALYVVDNASSGGGTQSAPLVGLGIAPVGVFSPGQLSYNVTVLGTTVTRDTVLTNEGMATLSLNPSSWAITGNNPGSFHIANNTCGATLAIGASCVVSIAFAPQTYAFYSADLTVQDDSGGVPSYIIPVQGVPTRVMAYVTQTMHLTGAIAPPAQTSSFTLGNAVFPLTTVGETTTQAVTLTLNTAVALRSIQAAPGFPEYSVGRVAGCAVDGVTVNPAGTICSIPVTFKPTAPGLRSAPLLISVVESGTVVPYSFGLTGKGSGPLVALTPGIITTVVGRAFSSSDGIAGADGPATAAPTGFLTGMALDASGQIFLADSGNNVIWKVDTLGDIHLFAGTPFLSGGYVEAMGGDGGTALGAALGYVGPIALDSSGGLYLGDTDGYAHPDRLRYIDPATNLIGTVAGYVAPGSWVASAHVAPTSRIVAVVNGTPYLFVAKQGGTSGAGEPTWPPIVDTLISDGTVLWQNRDIYFGGPGCVAQADTWGDGCDGTQATLGTVAGVATDASGNVYFSDSGASLIRRYEVKSKLVTAIAGTGTAGSNGDGGPATAAQVSPSDLAFDSKGNLYFIDGNGSYLRKIDSLTGTISTIAGQAGSTAVATQCTGDSGSGGPASAATFAHLTSIAFDAADNAYLVDQYACRVSRIDAVTGNLHKVAGADGIYDYYNGGSGNLNERNADGDATLATLAQPGVLRLDGFANLYLASAFGGVRKIDVSQSVLNFSGSNRTDTFSIQQPLNTVSAAQTVTAVNAGNSGVLNFSPPFLSRPLWGITGTDFIRDVTSPLGTPDCYSLTSLGPGAECPISVDFAPASSTGWLASVNTVTDTALTGNGSQPIRLIGYASNSPLVTLTPPLLSFSAAQGGTSPSQTLTLTNHDTAPLPISSITIAGSGATAFSQTNDCGTLLAASSSCHIDIAFSPGIVPPGPPVPQPDILSATLSVIDTFNGSPQVAQLTGTGTLPAVGSSIPITETITVSDVVLLIRSPMETISENITVSDAVVVVMAPMEAIPENITVSDAVFVIPSPMETISENITVLDTVLVVPATLEAIHENITISDAVVVVAASPVIVQEMISVADDVLSAAAIPVILHEVVRVGDVAVPISSLVLNLTENLSISEAVLSTPATVLTLNENLSLADAVVLTPATVLTLQENLSLSDKAVLSPPIILKLNETLFLAEAVKLTPATVLNLNENLMLSDGKALIPATVLTLRENLSLSDKANLAPPLVLNLNETLFLAEAVTLKPATVLTLNENLMLSDGKTFTPATVLTLHENLSLSDKAVLSPPIVLKLNETLFLAEAVKLTPATVLTLNENLLLADAVVLTPATVLTLHENLSLSDKAVLSPPIVLKLNETLLLAEAVTLQPATVLTLNENLSLSDIVRGTPATVLTLSETLLLSDVEALPPTGAFPPNTITFLPIPDIPFSAVRLLTLTARSTSGLPVVYTVTGPAVAAGVTLILTGIGQVSVTALQSGDGAHAASLPVMQIFTVTP